MLSHSTFVLTRRSAELSIFRNFNQFAKTKTGHSQIKQLKLSNLIRTNFAKRVFLKHKKNEHHHRIPHCRNSLGTKFQLNKEPYIFGSNLPKNGISGVKQKR